jgi:transglutaminase-like putative cysteine protease
VLIAFLSAALAMSGLLLVRSLLLPRIGSIRPTAFEPGSSVVIEGKGFGEQRGNRGVKLDGSPLTAASYLSWNDTRIEVIIPNTADSGLVKVYGPLGESNAEIVVSRSKTPQASQGITSASVRPSISSITPEKAQIGELVTIEGMGFGNNLQFSAVRFSLNRAASAARPANEDYIEPEAAQSVYESWDDKEISVRVPEGAGSGTVQVRTPQGESQPVSFSVEPGTGRKNIYDPTVYTIEFNIDVRRRRMDQGGSVLIYLPDPSSTSAQTLDSIQDEGMAPVEEARDGLAVYRIDGQGSGEDTIMRTARLTVSAEETDLTGYRDGFRGSRIPAFLLPWLVDEPGLPAGAREVVALAAKIVGRESNPQRKATLIWSWMKQGLDWDGPSTNPDRSALAALREGRGDTRQTALLACALLRAANVPAVPISGLLVKKDGTTLPHSWLEYYLPALGWVPFDPVLASGARPSGFDAGFGEPSRYFGSMDNRHIAITKGILKIPPRLRGSKLKEKGAAWSLQTLYEESSGAFYSSTWSPVRLTGEY